MNYPHEKVFNLVLRDYKGRRRASNGSSDPFFSCIALCC